MTAAKLDEIRALADAILAAANDPAFARGWDEGLEQRIAQAADRAEAERDFAAIGLSDGPRWTS